jgi:hypothetical protein
MREVVLAYLFVLGAIAFYGIVRIRLIQATQSYRINAARLADDLLDDERLTDTHRRMLVFGIEHAFDGTQPWKFLKTVVRILVWPKGLPWGEIERRKHEDPELRRKLGKAIGNMALASLAMSPLATFLLVLVLTAGLLLHASAATIWLATMRATELMFMGRVRQQH